MKSVRQSARPIVTAISSLLLAGCESSAPQRDQAVNAPVSVPTSSSRLAAPILTPTPTYVPHFNDREGDTYFYATAASEEDQKKGSALGNVVSLRYLGERNGKHTIVSVDGGGHPLLRYECSNPCKIIKSTFRSEIERLPYDTRSVIGGAFEDAFHGSLKVASTSGGDAELTQVKDGNSIPAAFIGEWNTDVEACGTGNNDSRLRIEPRRVRFYESDGDVQRVTIMNQRAIKVSASFAGEGQTWTNDVEFVLSRSGNDLSSDGIRRHRCPA